MSVGEGRMRREYVRWQPAEQDKFIDHLADAIAAGGRRAYEKVFEYRGMRQGDALTPYLKEAMERMPEKRRKTPRLSMLRLGSWEAVKEELLKRLDARLSAAAPPLPPTQAAWDPLVAREKLMGADLPEGPVWDREIVEELILNVAELLREEKFDSPFWAVRWLVETQMGGGKAPEMYCEVDSWAKVPWLLPGLEAIGVKWGEEASPPRLPPEEAATLRLVTPPPRPLQAAPVATPQPEPRLVAVDMASYAVGADPSGVWQLPPAGLVPRPSARGQVVSSFSSDPAVRHLVGLLALHQESLGDIQAKITNVEAALRRLGAESRQQLPTLAADEIPTGGPSHIRDLRVLVLGVKLPSQRGEIEAKNRGRQGLDLTVHDPALAAPKGLALNYDVYIIARPAEAEWKRRIYDARAAAKVTIPDPNIIVLEEDLNKIAERVRSVVSQKHRFYRAGVT